MNNWIEMIRDSIASWFGTVTDWPPADFERPEEWPLPEEEFDSEVAFADDPIELKNDIKKLQDEIKELKEMKNIFDGE